MKRFSILSLLLLVTLVGCCLGWLFGPSRLRTALPWNATEINEYYWDAGFLPDFTRVLKAKIKEGEFEGYCERLGFTEKYSDNPDDQMYWPNCDEKWWDPPDSFANLRYEPIHSIDYRARAAYHNGYIYVAVDAW